MKVTQTELGCAVRAGYSNLLRSPPSIAVSKEFVASRTGRAFWKVHDEPELVPHNLDFREYLPLVLQGRHDDL